VPWTPPEPSVGGVGVGGVDVSVGEAGTLDGGGGGAYNMSTHTQKGFLFNVFFRIYDEPAV